MRLLPAPTRGNGDCAFHAACGEWNGEEFVYTEIKALRKKVADKVRAISIGSPNLFPSVSEAIKELIRGNNQQINLTPQKFPLITARQQTYKKADEGFEDLETFDPLLNGSIVAEYARFIETPGMWLLPCELSVIAYALEITIHQFGNGKNGEFIRLETYNPRASTQYITNVYFNGSNHYEAMKINTEGLISSLAQPLLATSSQPLSLEGTHKASGSKKVLHGIIYQLKLLILFLYRGYIHQYQSCLSTEREDAEKFDDLVFKYKPVDSTDYRYRFLQAKHKQDDNEVISALDLLNLNEGEFSLIKYFAAFQKIKSNLIFKDGILEEFCICTNIGFDFDPIRDQHSTLHLLSALEKVTTPDPLLDTQDSKATKYRFKKGLFPGREVLYKHIKQNTQHIRLAQELKKQINQKNKIDLRNPLLKDYHEWLIQNGIIHSKTHKLTVDFLTGQNLSPIATQFYAYYHGIQTEDLSLMDTDIDEFLEHMVFAVNQPNEISLEGILVQELANEFNLKENSELLYAELQNVTLAWMKDKKGTFLTHHTIKTLFDELRKKLNRLALIGPTLDYQKKLQQSGFTFTPASSVQNFLNSTKQVMIYQTLGDLFLGSMHVYQTLQSLNVYKTDNSYIFVTLKKALRLTQLVTQSFGKSKLLVLACNIPLENAAKELLQTLFKELPPQVKIILITAQPQKLKDLLVTYSLKFDEHRARGDFSELNQASQSALQKRLTYFQGVATTLEQLVPNLDHIIDATVLSELIGVQENVVGSPLAVNEITYFIERKFKRQAIVPSQYLTTNTEDIFAIASTQKDKLTHLLGPEHAISSFSEVGRNTSFSSRLILLDQEDASAQFKALCTQYPNRTIHYLVHQDKRLVWYTSHGSLDKLRPHLKPERNIDELQDGCSIISAEPGMGKTTILSYLIHKLQQHKPNLWIFNINLLTIESRLRTFEFIDKTSVVHFFMEEATQLERKIFEYRLQHGGIAFFFDGFDEIHSTQQTKVTRLLGLLKTTRAEKIVITTRRHMQEKLEESLSTFSYRLQSFNEEDIFLFFEKFWQNLLKIEEINSEKVTRYVEELIEIFRQSVETHQREFIGIPLQTQLLATAFAKDFQQFYEGENEEPHFPARIPLFELYERFVKTKFEIALRDKLQLIETIQQSMIGPILIEKLEEYHQLLAMHILFPDVHALTFPLQENHISLVNIAGMIQFINGEIRSVHRTFSEFFAARFLIKQLQKPSSHSDHQFYKSFLIQHIFKARYEVIRTFIEGLIEQSEQGRLQQAWQTIYACNLLPAAINHQDNTNNSVEESLSDSASSDDGAEPSSSRDDASEHSYSGYSTSHDSSSAEFSTRRGKLDIYSSTSELNSEDSENSDSEEENTSTQVSNPVKYSFEAAERLVSYAKNNLEKNGITSLKANITKFCSHILNTHDIPGLEKSLNILKEVLRNACQIEIKKHVVGKLVPLLTHYVHICINARKEFNNILIQSFKDIDVPGKKKDVKELLDHLFIWNEFYGYQRNTQRITILFLAKLTEGKILYLWQLEPLEISPLLIKSLVAAYPKVKLQREIYTQLLFRVATIHQDFLDKLRYLVVMHGDLNLMESIKVTFPDRYLPLSRTEVIEMAAGKSVSWLEKYGFPLLSEYGILTSQITQKFHNVLKGNVADTHANKIWYELLNKLLGRPYADIIDSDIDMKALLSFCLDTLKHLSKEEDNDSPISISRVGLNNLLKLIETKLTELVPEQEMLSYCFSLLVYLNKIGLLLIDTGKTLLLLEPISEFEYELLLHQRHQMVKELLLFKAKNPEDNINFEQECSKALTTLNHSSSRRKRLNDQLDHSEMEEQEPPTKKHLMHAIEESSTTQWNWVLETPEDFQEQLSDSEALIDIDN